MGHTVRFLLLVPILVIAANPEGKRGEVVWSASGGTVFLQEPGRLRCAQLGAR